MGGTRSSLQFFIASLLWFSIPGSEPFSVIRAFARPDQPHIRSAMTGPVQYPACGGQARAARPFSLTAVRQGSRRFADPDPPGLI